MPTRDISVVISLQSCPSSAKFGSTSACSGRGPLGFDDSILYAGPYSPQGTPGSGTTDVSQTFHLQIPRNFTPGPAMLSTAHFLLTEGVTVSTCSIAPTVNDPHLSLTFRDTRHSSRPLTSPSLFPTEMKSGDERHGDPSGSKRRR